MNPHRPLRYQLLSLFLVVLFSAHVNAQDYVLIGWSKYGMHSSGKDYSKVSLMPPSCTIRAQLVYRTPGALPKAVTHNVTIEYHIPSNTTSSGKTNFWTYAAQLFGLTQALPADVGLTGKGLSGVLDTTGNAFEARGIPLTPYPDSTLSKESPFQLIQLVARVSGSQTVLATTEVVIPVSNEVGCIQSGCHGSDQDILNDHESMTGFNKSGPVLCAQCHASAALGTTGITSAKTLSFVLHDKHKNRIGPAGTMTACYRCHPGPNTRHLRGIMAINQTKPLICQDCHGSAATVASTITAGRRPWLDEPTCSDSTCHGKTYAQETGKLFKDSKGHGKMFCSACHGSAHAILPSREENDNLQNIRLQGYAGALRDCRACHALLIPVFGPHGLNYTSAPEIDEQIPRSYSLSPNFPNPFNPSTTISFSLSRQCFVTLTVFDPLGREVRTLMKDLRDPGVWSTRWDGTDNNRSPVTSGVYLYRLTAREASGGSVVFDGTRSMVYLK